MRERTITINGLSKSYSVTGWRVGWAVAPPAITNAIRKVHDFLTVGAPAPLQEAGAAALSLPAELLSRTGRPLPDAARSSDSRAGESRLPLLSSAGRVLRDDRHQRLRIRERRGVRRAPGERNRHCLRARDRASTSIRKTDPNRYVSPSAKSLRHWMRRRGGWKSLGRDKRFRRIEVARSQDRSPQRLHADEDAATARNLSEVAHCWNRESTASNPQQTALYFASTLKYSSESESCPCL